MVVVGEGCSWELSREGLLCGASGRRGLSFAFEWTGEGRGGLQGFHFCQSHHPHGHLPETRTGAEADHRTRVSLHVSVVVTMTLKAGESRFRHTVFLPPHSDPPASAHLHSFLAIELTFA